MTGFETTLAAAGAASGIISALAIFVISGSPRLGAGAAAAVWTATAAVIILDLTAVQTALTMAVACAPFAAAGIAAARRAERKNAEEACRTLAKLLPQGWNREVSPRGAGREAGPEDDPEGSPDDVNIIIDPSNHPAERVRTAMANCLAGRRGDTARVIAEDLAANLQARIDRGQRKTREAMEKIAGPYREAEADAGKKTD